MQRRRSAPYAKPPPARPASDQLFSKDDSATDSGVWKHDKFAAHNNVEGGTLAARLTATRRGTDNLAPKADMSFARKAVEAAQAPGSGWASLEPVRIGTGRGLSIKGVANTTVEVSGLVGGTTAADVEAIFKRCGDIAIAELVSSSSDQLAVVRIQFLKREAAETAVSKFNGQPADGRTLKVVIVQSPVDTITARFGVTGTEAKVRSVDVLLESSASQSKMRSDEILSTDRRAQRVIDSSGVNVNAIPNAVRNTHSGRARGGRGGRGGGVRRGRGLQDRIGGAAMQID